jgi:hypothetical protein
MLAVALLVSGSFAIAEEVKSGLQAGKFIGPFYVTKLAGAKTDGVKVGANLCYRCKNGGRPQVMVFTRSTDKKVVDLVKGLDKAIAKHEKQELRVFVNVLGDSKAAATKEAKKLAKETGAKGVPFVVPNEFENGPDDYGINTKADVTIILAQGGEVKVNHAFTAGKEVDAKTVISSLSKIVK